MGASEVDATRQEQPVAGQSTTTRQRAIDLATALFQRAGKPDAVQSDRFGHKTHAATA